MCVGYLTLRLAVFAARLVFGRLLFSHMLLFVFALCASWLMAKKIKTKKKPEFRFPLLAFWSSDTDT